MSVASKSPDEKLIYAVSSWSPLDIDARLSLIDEAIAEGANPNGTRHQIPLYLALHGKHINARIVARLLEAGADPFKTYRPGQTRYNPLSYLIERRKERITNDYVNRLSRAGFNETRVKRIIDKVEGTEIAKIAKLMIDKGLNVNMLMFDRGVPLFVLIEDPAVFKVFLENGLDLFVIDSESGIPFLRELMGQMLTNPEFIHIIMDHYGDTLIDGIHVALLLLRLIPKAYYYQYKSNTPTTMIERYLDILESRGFDAKKPLDDTGRTLIMELAQMKNTAPNTLAAAKGTPGKNIYGRSAANYAWYSKRRTAGRRLVTRKTRRNKKNP